MRRGINIRKKKKIIFNELNRKSLKLLTLLLVILIICITVYIVFIQDTFIKSNLEQDSLNFSLLNENIPFSLNKIILFSSATAESTSINQSLGLNISNYCDIGIYLNPLTDKDISISALYIDNIDISSPEIGTPYLYKKIILDLGKNTFDENNIINDRFDLNIIDTNKNLSYNNYEIYNNGTTPISLGFYNKNIKTDFISDNSEILYNGTLLKDAAIPLTSLRCNISFTLNIITNNNEHYICNVKIDVPFSNANGSIYDLGHITQEFESNATNKFIRVK